MNYILPIKSIFHNYPNIHYHIYTDYLQIYTSFPSYSDSGLIQMSIFINCRFTDITEWFSHMSLSLNMTTTDTTENIISRPSSHLSITYPFIILIFHPYLF